MSLEQMAEGAKKASRQIAMASTEQKNGVLRCMIETIGTKRRQILEENQIDIDEARTAQLSVAMIDRLSIQSRLDDILADIEQVIKLPDPVGECFEEHSQGTITTRKCRTPLGVLGVIYESRPNITIDISTLSLKSGNCAILRGGSESLRTNKILVECIQDALSETKMPREAIQLVLSTDRAEVHKMLRLHQSIDLIIPRGGAALHSFCRENSTIPVITGGVGVCHLYVDATVDMEKALPVLVNAKTQRPTVCNALDTLLVHKTIAEEFIPKTIQLLSKSGVKFHLDSKSATVAKERNCWTNCVSAAPEDWNTEWLSLVLGIKIVDGIEEAIQHIANHSTGHSDGILTEDSTNADRFVKEVDSAAVYVNASTRFTDGGQLGLGAEVAISTQKFHARGPMGLRELTSYKWIINGNYATRR